MKALAALVLLWAGLAAAQRKPLPWEKNRHLGKELYREHCVVCHDIDKPQDPKSKKPGPSLHKVFESGKLPLTGGKPTREYMAVKIKFGGQIMPAFIKRLTDAEVELVVDYLESAGQK
jgi:mono/diheme cytochrome c family protein